MWARPTSSDSSTSANSTSGSEITVESNFAIEEPPLLQRPADVGDALKTERTIKQSDLPLIYSTFVGVFIGGANEALILSTYSAIASQFERLSEGSWLVVAYSFGYCVALPVYGVLSDSYGRKNVLLSAYALFMLGNLACGASTSFAELVAARAISGLGGAGMISLTAIIMTDFLPPGDLALYRGYENMVNVVGRALGAPIGGILVDTIGWRWSFFGQIPFIIACSLAVLYAFRAPPNKDEEHTASSEDTDSPSSSGSSIQDLDIAGIITLSAAILSLLYLVQEAGSRSQKQPSALLPLLVVAFVASCSAFIAIEVLWAKSPLVPVHLFSEALGLHFIIQILLCGGRFVFMTNLTPYFIRVDNVSNLHASLLYIMGIAGISVGGIASGLIIRRTRRVKSLLVVAISITAVGFAMIFFLWRHGSSIWGDLPLLLISLGPGLSYNAFFTALSSGTPERFLAVTISTYFLAQELGTITGPAFGLALSQGLLERNLQSALGNMADKEKIITRILNDVRYAWTLAPSLQETVRSCYLAAFPAIPLCSGIAAAVIIPLILALKEPKIG